MKKILFLIAFAFSFLAVEAQKVDYLHPVKYSKKDPTIAPKSWEGHLWFNTTTSHLWKYNRTERDWEDEDEWLGLSYGEMSIANDTSTISFTNTTALPIQDLTAGPLKNFSMVSDSVLRYDGSRTAVFSVNYSATILFAEAANLIRGYVEIDGSQNTRTAFRQTMTLTTENETVGGTALVSLAPGALIRFMFFPGTHTGTDVLTIPNFNLNLTEVK